MPRYAVLAHDWPSPHFDLLLEDGESCLTWRLKSWPVFELKDATPLPRHRLMYLDYEGPVSGDRGQVTRVEAGIFAWFRRDNEFHVELTSENLSQSSRKTFILPPCDGR